MIIEEPTPSHADRLLVVARFRAKVGREDDLQDALIAMIEPTGHDRGLIYYRLYRGTDPLEFCFVEEWDDADSLDEHGTKPHIDAFGAQRDELVDGEVTVQRFRFLRGVSAG